MSTHKQKLAIFDIDGTVFRSSLLIEVFNALVHAGVFPQRASRQVERNFVSWLDRKGHYDDYLMTLVHVYYDHLKGKLVSKFEPVIDSVVEWQRDRVYRYTRDMLEQLKKKGFYLLAISNSQDSMVERFSSSVGFDAALGRPLEIKKGRYTGMGIVDGKQFPVDMKLDKPKLLRDFLESKEMVADMKRSMAFGDSEGDLDILSIVGHPVAFNPSYELAKIAQRRKWSVVVERKDVMYRIHKADIMVSRERPKKNRHRRRT